MSKVPLAECDKCPAKSRPLAAKPEGAPTIVRLAVVGAGPWVPTPRLRLNEVSRHHAVLCRVTDKELNKAAACCRKRLQAELSGLSPDVPVLALGPHAYQGSADLGRRPNIMETRGSVNRANGRLVFPTIEPLTAKKSPIWEPVLEHDINRVYKYLGRSNYVPPEEAPGRETVTGDESLERLDHLGAVVSLDIETTVAPPHEAKLVCVGFSDGRLQAVVPWSSDLHGEDSYWPHPWMVAKAINRVLETRVAVTHNGPAFDHIVLQRHGIHVPNWEDSILAAHASAGHLPKRLSHVVSMYLDTPAWKQEHAADRMGEGEGLEPMWRYNARDCLYTRLTWEQMQRDLEPVRATYEHDKVVSKLCAELAIQGIAYDLPRAREFSKVLQSKETELNAQADKLANRPIKLLSSKDLKQLFFRELRAPVFFRTDSGEPSLGVQAMRGYAQLANERISELATTILEYRRVRKIRSTYIDAIYVYPDGRVRPNWVSYGTVTGRWACREPNLQNLPRADNDPTKGAGGIRSLYRAAPGKVLVGFDAKQLEMRIAAYWSQDPGMIKACESEDMHSTNAGLIFGVGEDHPNFKNLRQVAKFAGLAALYDSSDVTIAGNLAAIGLTMSVPGVGAVMGRVRVAFKGFYQARDKLMDDVRRRGWLESPIIGRRRWLGHNPRQPEVSNSPCQMGAADLLNIKLPIIRNALRPIQGARLVAQVHDAGYVECFEADADRVAEVFQEVFSIPVMNSGIPRVFPIDVKQGLRWSDV